MMQYDSKVFKLTFFRKDDRNNLEKAEFCPIAISDSEEIHFPTRAQL